MGVACDQDFSLTCPKGWSEIGGLCVAPATYAGDCSFSVNTTGMSDVQKSALGFKCGVEFPCMGGGSGNDQGRSESESSSSAESPSGPIEYETGRIHGF